MSEIIKKIWIFVVGLLCVLITGCGEKISNSDNVIELFVSDFSLRYDGKVKLERVYLNDSDLLEIVELYQEVGDEVAYRDSFLVAERYDQGLGVNAFVQQNLDSLETQGLSLNHVKKTWVSVEKKGKIVDGILVEYEIDRGFISSVPIIYMSQLFVPGNSSIILFSYMTESTTARSHASNMLKNIN